MPLDNNTQRNANATEHFIELPVSDIRKIVAKRQPDLSCVCLADGYRRVVRMETGLIPNSEEFCNEYSRLFCQSLKKTLEIFFKHGVKTLFFPLFGPSLLTRNQLFKTITIPSIYKNIFIRNDFQDFYQDMGIRIRAYGQIDRTEDIDIKNLNMKQGIFNCIKKNSSNNRSHTLYFGFMSRKSPEIECLPQIISFHQQNQRPPTLEDIQRFYYGEAYKPLDLIISSTQTPRLRALPPLIDIDQASTYSFIAPFDWAFNEKTFRRILFDRLFANPPTSTNEYLPEDLLEIDNLKEYYQENRHIILTPGNPPSLIQLFNPPEGSNE